MHCMHAARSPLWTSPSVGLARRYGFRFLLQCRFALLTSLSIPFASANDIIIM